MTESNGTHVTPAPRVISRVLLLETTTDVDGVREVETREATEEEMLGLGWVRRIVLCVHRWLERTDGSKSCAYCGRELVYAEAYHEQTDIG